MEKKISRTCSTSLYTYSQIWNATVTFVLKHFFLIGTLDQIIFRIVCTTCILCLCVCVQSTCVYSRIHRVGSSSCPFLITGGRRPEIATRTIDAHLVLRITRTQAIPKPKTRRRRKNHLKQPTYYEVRRVCAQYDDFVITRVRVS